MDTALFLRHAGVCRSINFFVNSRSVTCGGACDVKTECVYSLLSVIYPVGREE